MRFALFALIASLGLLAACSSGGNGAVSTATSSSSAASGTSTSSASSTTSDPRTQQQIDGDRAAAQAAVLKLADLPTGWTSHASTDSSGGADVVQAQMAACLGVDSSFFKKSDKARVRSDDFDDPDDTMEVSNTVAVTASTSTANFAMDVYSKAEVPSCLGQSMDQAINQQATASGSTLPAGTTIGKSQVAPESFPNVADRTTAYRVTVPVKTSSQSVNITIDYVIFVKGRTGATLTLQGNGTIVPASLATSLAQTVAGRMPSS